jgi:hypothetical protein
MKSPNQQVGRIAMLGRQNTSPAWTTPAPTQPEPAAAISVSGISPICQASPAPFHSKMLSQPFYCFRRVRRSANERTEFAAPPQKLRLREQIALFLLLALRKMWLVAFRMSRCAASSIRGDPPPTPRNQRRHNPTLCLLCWWRI